MKMKLKIFKHKILKQQMKFKMILIYNHYYRVPLQKKILQLQNMIRKKKTKFNQQIIIGNLLKNNFIAQLGN